MNRRRRETSRPSAPPDCEGAAVEPRRSEQNGEMAVALVQPRDHAWPTHFQQAKAFPEPGVVDVNCAIEHVGSTAIPGMMAKPITDTRPRSLSEGQGTTGASWLCPSRRSRPPEAGAADLVDVELRVLFLSPSTGHSMGGRPAPGRCRSRRPYALDSPRGRPILKVVDGRGDSVRPRGDWASQTARSGGTRA